jgi:hypothetical protein
MTRARDGSTWHLGTDADVAWIAASTAMSRTITAAVPPVFDAYAVIAEPDTEVGWRQHDLAVAALLGQHSADQAWWLGYLDTGADDVIFPDAPRVRLYYDWNYVLVQAGPGQAASWRSERGMHGVLPELIFPADHSWLASTMWDDDWSCLGGPAGLVKGFLNHPDLQARPVTLREDLTLSGPATG